MNILLCNDTYYPHVNGSSYFTQRFAYYLQKAGHRVTVLAPSRSFAHEHFYHNGISIYALRSISLFAYGNDNKFRTVFPFFMRREISRVIDLVQPDVVHVQGHFLLSSALIKVAHKKGIPIVGTNHFMPENLVHYFPLSSLFGEWYKKQGWAWFCRVFNKVEYVTTPTHTAAQLLHDIHYNKPVQAISCGIDLERFHVGPHEEKLRKRYGIEKKPTLIFVGRLDPEKNVDLVLRALQIVQKKIDVQFLICGKGEQEQQLRELAYSLGLHSIIFAGFVPDEDLPGIYRFGYCCMSSGNAELQSIMTMEAMASGLPVVAVKAMALPELAHQGENAFLYPDGNVHALADALVRLFSDEALRKKMGKKSLEIIQHHDIKKTISAYEKIYQEVIEKRKKK